MHIERLERMERCLREHVRADAGFIFNLSIWCMTITVEKHTCCGTSGCAIGLALHQRIFEKEGLRLFSTGPVLVNEKGIQYHGFDAIDVLFDLEPGQARYLFTIPNIRAHLYKDAYGPSAALACADRIRELIDSVKVKPVTEKVLELA
jgi:hypothetical protein